MPTSSVFFTNLITFINRIIIANKNWFFENILTTLYNHSGILFVNFIESWISKIDYLVSRESMKINLISLYTVIPHFSHDMLVKYFGEIGRITFGQLDQYMYLKLTNNQSRFHSPSKINNDKCTFPYGGTQALK
jgi:hypothetical protein